MSAFLEQEEKETTAERVFFHDDDAFHDRTDWFLVAHTILLEAFVSAYEHPWAATIIVTFGVVSAWSWLTVSLRQHGNLEATKAAFREASPFYAKVHQIRSDRFNARRTVEGPLSRTLFRWQLATVVFGRILPTCTVAMWFLLAAGRLWPPGHRIWACFDPVSDCLRQFASFVMVILMVLVLIAVRWPRGICRTEK